MAKLDLKDLKLDQIVEDIRGEAGKRASELLGEGRTQIQEVRRKVADPNDGDMPWGFALGLLVGAVIGAAVALLVAPQSGTETRRTLAERAKSMRGEGSSDWDAGTSVSGDGRGYQTGSPYGTTPSTPYGTSGTPTGIGDPGTVG